MRIKEYLDECQELFEPRELSNSLLVPNLIWEQDDSRLSRFRFWQQAISNNNSQEIFKKVDLDK